ncbi:ER membrane protein complex subunit 1-like [Bolinopsis microptera]|uniref:ER membrane protein complex subunit 1-like n=1 Tax=Bolinopsis microptera TaxID=2820187 RepID=UPI00307A0770
MFKRTVLLVLVLIAVVQSIYEDQIGLYDWHQRYVGAVEHRIADSRAIVVITKKNILAALHPKTGAIMWRRKFNEEDTVTVDPVICGEEVVTYHSTNRYRHWDILTGMLTLDTPHHEEDGLLFYASLSYEKMIRVTRNNVYWGKNDNIGSSPIDISPSMKFAGFMRSGSKVEGFLFDPSTAQGVSIKYDANHDTVQVAEAALPSTTQGIKLVTSEDSIAGLQGDSVFYKTIGEDSFLEVKLSDIGITWSVDSISAAGKSTYIVSGKQMSAVIAVMDGAMRAVKAISKDVIGQVVGSDHIALVSRADHTVSLVQLSNGFEAHSYSLGELAEGRGGVLSMTTLTASHPCSLMTTVRVPGLFLTWKDQSVTVVGSNKTCGWIREESLSSVVSATLLDLPASSFIPVSLHRHTNPIKLWTERITMQLQDLQKFINLYFGTALIDVSPEMERDSFNLNKLIFAISTCGKVHVLHSGTARIIWSRYLDNIAPLSNGQYQVHMIRSASHYPLPALVAVLGTSLDSKKAVLTVLNPLDGSLQYRQEFESKLAQIQLTAVEDNEFAKVMLILTDDNEVHTYPPRLHKLVEHLPLYFTLVYPDQMELKGFFLKGTRVEETWSAHLRGDKILDVKSKATNDAVYSQGRVLGDRSVLHKYINPNVMAVAVESGAGDKVLVDVQLYDMISGTQLYHARHKQYSGPVHLLVVENWLLYHIWCSKLRRYEVVVVEFFLPSAPNTTEFSSLFPRTPSFSIQQAYIATSPLSAVAVTTTLKSITNRAVLFAESGGRIALVPKALLDPRRPTIPTAEDRQEQLVPYTPQLALAPMSYVTYNKTLQDITGMVTGVTGLESTSLLFAYGTDLYFARVTPAKTFDMLNEDFDYYLIGLVLLGLCFATIVTQALAENKALNKKWK